MGGTLTFFFETFQMLFIIAISLLAGVSAIDRSHLLAGRTSSFNVTGSNFLSLIHDPKRLAQVMQKADPAAVQNVIDMVQSIIEQGDVDMQLYRDNHDEAQAQLESITNQLEQARLDYDAAAGALIEAEAAEANAVAAESAASELKASLESDTGSAENAMNEAADNMDQVVTQSNEEIEAFNQIKQILNGLLA